MWHVYMGSWQDVGGVLCHYSRFGVIVSFALPASYASFLPFWRPAVTRIRESSYHRTTGKPCGDACINMELKCGKPAGTPVWAETKEEL
tara:strand:+ start:131 stop:397 length:267 start_codon:yes stop_codon:yes gene_type:complete